MSTPREFPVARSPAGAGLAAPVAHSVAEDLEAIFPHEPPAMARPRRRLGRRQGEPVVTAPRESRTKAVGALLAAAFAGISAGALIGRLPAPSRPDPPQITQAAVIAPISALPNSGPLPAGSLRESPEDPRVAATATAEARAAPAKLRTVSARRRGEQRHQGAQAAACLDVACRTPSLAAADDRLREAYASAVDAGVSNNVLVDYSERWSHLRGQASQEPGVVVARYDEMAGELNSMAAGRQRAADRAATSHPAGWRGLRTQLAALWR